MGKVKRKYVKRDKIVWRSGIYFCVDDEGNGTGQCRLNYNNKSRQYVIQHQNATHNHITGHQTSIKKNVVWGRKKRAKTNLTSYITNAIATNALPLMPIQDYNSDSDWEDDIPYSVRLDLAKIEVAEERKYEESRAPYNANVPENPDIGPDATYALINQELQERESQDMDEEEDDEEEQGDEEEQDEKYIFSFYFGTTVGTQTVCIYLDGSRKTAGTAKLLKLMNAGHVCWRKDFQFRGGTSEENKYNAMYWQHFHKNVKLYKQMVPKDPHKVESVILNGGRRRKSFFKGVLSKEDRDEAKKIGWQNRTLIPVPSHLLQQDLEEKAWQPHELKVKDKTTKGKGK